LGLLVLAVGCFPRDLYAQFTDPRTYTVSPVGLNQLEIDYARAHADASLDPSLEVGGAHVDINQELIAYTRNVGLLDYLGWIKATVPFAQLSGSVAGTQLSGSTSGAGDASLELAMLLKGGRALSAAEFSKYEPATTWGAGVTITAPTGKYNPDKLLNLGANRWSFKPEIGVSHPFGPDESWVIDGYVNAYFFTDNTSYRGVEVLRQEPLPGVETHLSHDFTSHFWMSLDLRYAFRGDTAVDGVDQNSTQQSLVVGSEASWSPNERHTFALVFASAVVHKNAPAATGVLIRYTYSWGST
jgi:hypothetical protein